MALPLPSRFVNPSTVGASGLLGSFTASFFKLDPTGTIPVEPLADVIPSVTPFRVTLDMIDRDELIRNYSVTRHALQDLVDVTPHRKRNLKLVSITGTLSAAPALSLAGVPPPPTFGARLDQLRLSFLERIADHPAPIMIVTPRLSLPLGWIVGFRTPWTPADGRSTPVIIQAIEVRVASPELTDAVKDLDSLETGNTTAANGGEQAGKPINSTTTEPDVPQAAPTFGTAGVTGFG